MLTDNSLDWIEDSDSENDQDSQLFFQSMLPCQHMRILWDSFRLSVDEARLSNRYEDIQYAAGNYSDLVEAAVNLPDNQCEFWIERADGYLPLFWMAWMHWLEQWDNKVHLRLDS